MKLLLDTHAFLWYVEDSPNLSSAAREAISVSPGISISIASIWELALKHAIGKIGFPDGSFDDFISRHLTLTGANLLDVSLAHVSAVAALPLHHRDPFDRMLAAQAMAEGLTLVTRDPHLAAYPCDVLW